MKNIIVFALLICAIPVRADSFKHKAVNYVKTHKLLLTYDGNAAIAPFADAASSVHCLHTNINCFEQNGILSPRPSNARLYVSSGLLSVGLIVTGHTIWHFLPHEYGKQILPLVGATVDAGEFYVTRQNVKASEGLQ